jgi:hypothetical protein
VLAVEPFFDVCYINCILDPGYLVDNATVPHSVSCREQPNVLGQLRTTNGKRVTSRNPRLSQNLISEVNAVQSIATVQQLPRTRTMRPCITNDNYEHHYTSVERSAAGNTNWEGTYLRYSAPRKIAITFVISTISASAAPAGKEQP